MGSAIPEPPPARDKANSRRFPLEHQEPPLPAKQLQQQVPPMTLLGTKSQSQAHHSITTRLIHLIDKGTGEQGSQAGDLFPRSIGSGERTLQQYHA